MIRDPNADIVPAACRFMPVASHLSEPGEIGDDPGVVRKSREGVEQGRLRLVEKARFAQRKRRAQIPGRVVRKLPDQPLPSRRRLGEIATHEGGSGIFVGDARIVREFPQSSCGDRFGFVDPPGLAQADRSTVIPGRVIGKHLSHLSPVLDRCAKIAALMSKPCTADVEGKVTFE